VGRSSVITEAIAASGQKQLMALRLTRILHASFPGC